jgi:Zn-dependent M28 family amino/carboxypeptidase
LRGAPSHVESPPVAAWLEDNGRVRCTRFQAVALGLLFAGPALAYTQAEITQASLFARRINLVAVIAGDVYTGRNNNTPGSIAVQAVLINELAAVADGLNSAETGDAAYRQPFSTNAIGTNLLAVIPGTDKADEYVMIGAHYDHLGSQGSRIFNGATDNAAGVAAVLAIGKAFRELPTPPRRSVILALWDAQEDSLAGSAAYANAPLVPNGDVVAYINFDIQGSNLLPSLREKSFAIAAESGGALLKLLLQLAINNQNIDTRLLTHSFGQGRSDHANLLAVGVPTVFFTDATGSCHHTSGDDINIVDLAKLREQSQLAFRLAVSLTEIANPPAFVPGSPIVYTDAVEILHVLNGVAADIQLFRSSDQGALLSYRNSVQTMVDDGPAAFDLSDQFFLATITQQILDGIVWIQCNSFLPPPPPIPATNTSARIALAALLLVGATLTLRRRSKARAEPSRTSTTGVASNLRGIGKAK